MVRNVGTVLTIETTLTYSATTDFGHASAGKDLMLSLHESGADVGKAQLGSDNHKILGKFLSLDKDGVASYMADGKPMLLRKDNSTIRPGVPLVCAGGGR